MSDGGVSGPKGELMHKVLRVCAPVWLVALLVAGCGGESDPNIDSALADAMSDGLTNDAGGEAGDADAVETDGTDVVEPGDILDTVDAVDTEVTEADGAADTSVSDVDDTTPSVSPTDLAFASETLRRVFVRMGLDPRNARDVRRVWTNEIVYLEYLRAWAQETGVSFPEAGREKAECAFLTGFDPAVPYCGPGCGNDVTLAPPCLNRACFEHDACYAAYECETGNAIDVGLSFGPLMVCCDEPLNSIWTACVGSVAADFVAGRIGAADVALFNAVSALMVAMNNLSVLDAPTTLPPSDCSSTFEEACGEGELAVVVEPAEISEGGTTATVCATLQRDGTPVSTWTMDTRLTGPGSLSSASTVSDSEGRACMTYSAPTVLPDGETTVAVAIDAVVVGVRVASRVADLRLLGAMPVLEPNGPAARTLEVGDPATPVCFVARVGETPQSGVPVTFAMAGVGSITTVTGTTNTVGTACVSYLPPDAATISLDIVTASATFGGRSHTASVAISVERVEPSPDAVWVGTVEVSMYLSNQQPYRNCPAMRETSRANATLRVECDGLVSSGGGSCVVVRATGQYDNYRGFPPTPGGTVLSGTGLCESGDCPRGGTCIEDPQCECAPLLCVEEGLCMLGAVFMSSWIEFEASGPLENDLAGATILTFGAAPAGEVSGTVQDIRFQVTGFGGTYRATPTFVGEVSAADRESYLASQVSDIGPYEALTSLYAGRSADPIFSGTMTSDTITAAWVDPGFNVPSPPNGLLEGNASAQIRLRRIR